MGDHSITHKTAAGGICTMVLFVTLAASFADKCVEVVHHRNPKIFTYDKSIDRSTLLAKNNEEIKFIPFI